MFRTIVLAACAMATFAANSLLARLALGDASIGAVSYTAIRILSGALLLWLLALRRSDRAEAMLRGSWRAAAALFVYAIAFSAAYDRIGAATGALILFSSVQATMISWGVSKGERPSAREFMGLAVAFAAFVYYLSPGVARPDIIGSVLMMLSGVSWGVYTLSGRGSRTPLLDTAGNFVRAAPLAVVSVAIAAAVGGGGLHVSGTGALLAILSGAIASGLGYAVWYLALPGLTTVQAALVQLSVPVIAAGGAILLLSEHLTLRFAVAGAAVIGGIAFAIVSRTKGVRRQ